MSELKQLQQIKKQQNISYEKLAQKIGISYRTLFRWLSKKNKPSDMGLEMIKKFLKKNKKAC